MTQGFELRARWHGGVSPRWRLAAVLLCSIVQACGIAPLRAPPEVATAATPAPGLPQPDSSARQQQQQQQQQQRPPETRWNDPPAPRPQAETGTARLPPRFRGVDVPHGSGRAIAGKGKIQAPVLERGISLPPDAAALPNPAVPASPPSALPGSDPSSLEKETAKIDGLVRGSAGVSSPSKAKAGDTFEVYLRVSPDGAVQDLLRGLKEDVPENGTVLGRGNIGLTPRMAAGLSGFGFEILPKEVVTQAVSAKDPTTWVWQVKPVESGRLTLSFTLSGTLLIEGKEVPRNYYYKQDVEVAVSPMGFVGKYWQWLVSTLAIPAVAWLWSLWKRPSGVAAKPFFRARGAGRAGGRAG